MDKNNFITFVDYGSNAIRIGSYNKISKNFENHQEIIIQNLDSAISNQEKIIEKIVIETEKKNNEYLNEIFLMIDDLNILPIHIVNSKKLDESYLKKEWIEKIIEEIKYEIYKNYPDYEIMHTIIKNYVIDEKKFYELPENLNLKKFSINFLLLLLPKKVINNIKKIFALHNVSIKKFISTSYSKSLFYLEEIDSKNDIIFVDIGYRRTCTTYFENGRIEEFKILPIGGDHITKDISKVLKIDNLNAEEIKLNFDRVILDQKKNNTDIELIQKIIFSRIEELLEISTIFKDKKINLKNTKLIFFGNGSKIIDNKKKSDITFSYNIDLLEESYLETFSSGFKFLSNEDNIDGYKKYQKELKKGFFEKFFNIFS
tara:strand:- start:102 stop:1217 length:1116 start_codon:yes stop_codon:yes gene_type:complete